ncbi:protein disulfide-isomerase [Gouania willdenowi]|uniref:Protein disulfide-isomerase-like n=1 Tax=Gouania willdenowi TaxID=441366 RepID=A0A8C5E4C2_GOUWI|nr:protein disulfide-isomerase-like [Gouania willdenowi]
MRSLLLLFLMLTLCLCVTETQSDQHEDQPFTEEGALLHLKKGNFERALRKYTQLLVYFYTPFYTEGHRVLDVFQGAAAELQGSEVKLAVVDVTKEKDLVAELNAESHLSLRLYLHGDKHNPKLCPVPQTSTSILTWLKRRAGSASDLIKDFSQLETSEEVLVVGFFMELDHEYVHMFYGAAVELPDVSFALTQDNKVISKYGVAHNVILLFKQSKLIQSLKVTPDLSKEELIVFITVYQMDPVIEYNGQTASQILNSPVSNHALLFMDKSSADFEEISSAFSSAAEAFRLQLLFVLVDVGEPRNGRVMEYFRVRDFEAPVVRIVNMTDHVNFQMPSESLTVNTIKAFCQSYLDGTAKPKMMSQPIPDGWEEKPVKELVGMTLEKVAFHPNKTVFVLFYLPYSRASSAVFPLWDELAEAFKEREDVVIARIDASANDINLSTQGAYPSLCLFPALYAERMIIYTGKRNLTELVRFVDEEMENAKKHRVKEDEDRQKYMEAFKAEEEKKANQTKEEL